VSDGRALARAYLEQQRLLGTDAVMVPAPGEPTAPTQPLGAAPAPPTPGSRPESGDAASPSSGEVHLTPGASPGKFTKVDAGLTYDPPAQDLFSSDPVQRATTLAEIAELVAACTKCRLCEGRTNTVPGEGAERARLVVVGEGPGKTEDATGRPFVGKAGELLTKILSAIGLEREQVFICNIVKCRPPENRTPLYDEIATCVPYLFRQIELIGPGVILAMGNTAAQTLLNTKQSLGALRNKVHRFRGVPVIVTYHPAALLRNPNWKKPTWDDVRIAHRLLDG
jgi:uracil-DNA glycosylase family 4